MTNDVPAVLTERDLTERAAALMVAHVEIAAQRESLKPVLEGIRQLLIEMGVSVTRIQIPMTKLGGFRHPVYFGIMLTWNVDSAFDETFLITHEERTRQGLQSSVSDESPGHQEASVPEDSPFFDLLKSEQPSLRIDLMNDDLRHEILKKLRAQGMVDYLALALPVPGMPLPQLMSFTADVPFPDGFEARLSRVKDVIALSLYGACQASQAMAVARTYLGRRTGERVLNGDIARGFTQEVEAGIMFCDIRGFTALSQELGGAKIIPLMNALFEAIGQAATARGGEILKFIGDAMLIVFRLENRPPQEVADAMVQTTEEAIRGVAAIAQTHGLDLKAGFGCHLGEVLYGNIGTPDRLDFTVMGPAVNLTSRLEGLTKRVGCAAVFSQAIAEHVHTLEHGGDFVVKGITDPVAVYVNPQSP